MATVAITVTVGALNRSRTFTIPNPQFQNLIDWLSTDYVNQLPANFTNQDVIDLWINNFMADARVKEKNSRIKRGIQNLVDQTAPIDVT